MTRLDELAVELEEARQKIVELAVEEVRLCHGAPDSFPEPLAAAVAKHEASVRALGMETLAVLRTPGEVVPGSTRQVVYREDSALVATPASPPPKEPPPVPDDLVYCNGLNCSRKDGVETCAGCGLTFCPDHVDQALHPCGDQAPDSY